MNINLFDKNELLNKCGVIPAGHFKLSTCHRLSWDEFIISIKLDDLSKS